MAQCAECTYLDINYGHSSGKFWCDKKCERHFATDPECGSFCRAYSRESCTINNAIEISRQHNSSDGCYLTTMLCSILQLPDSNIYLDTIRNFRNNVLQKDDCYKQLLVEYDIIGPKIAEALSNDPLKDRIAKIYFNNYITTIVHSIKNNKYDMAINKYIEMTNNLKNFYGITDYNITLEEVNNADIEKSGHGRYVQKKITLHQ